VSCTCSPRPFRSWVAAALIAFAVAIAALLAALVLAVPANAGTGGAGATGSGEDVGGVLYETRPVIESFRCRKDCPNPRAASSRGQRTVEPGSTVVVRGQFMDRVATVVLFGGPGTRDDVKVRPVKKTRSWLTIKVPAKASSGRLRAIGRDGRRSPVPPAPLVVVEPEPEPEPEPAEPETNDQEPAPSSGFIWPLRGGTVTSPFGPRWGRLHAGIDVADSTGTPIRAAASGVVTHNSWAGGYGNYVCIRHQINGQTLTSCYGHLSRFGTTLGARVRQGQTIGYVGCTGSCTGPHVHFEIRVGPSPSSTPRNPMSYLPRRASASIAGAGLPMHFDLDHQHY
jgi:murein DD-endopeptidase MepM/ murein hydrolase activator NlpD